MKFEHHIITQLKSIVKNNEKANSIHAVLSLEALPMHINFPKLLVEKKFLKEKE